MKDFFKRWGKYWFGVLIGVISAVIYYNSDLNQKPEIRQPVFIGDVYEGSNTINISMVIQHELIEVNDTLFFIAKNDSMYTCGNKYGDIYLIRYKY